MCESDEENRGKEKWIAAESVCQRVCGGEKVTGSVSDHQRRPELNSRTLIKRASQLGTRQASHKKTRGREVAETRCVCVRACVRLCLCA